MPRSVQVALGGREYTVREKPMGANIEWRTRLHNSRVYRIVDSLEQSLATIVGAVKQVATLGEAGTDWAQVIGAAQILPVVVNGLMHSIDDVWALIFAYAPEIKADEEWLKENAYDQEGVDVFLEILKLNFPIMALWGLLNGSRVQQTPSNSPARNGASGLPASGPVRKKSSTSS